MKYTINTRTGHAYLGNNNPNGDHEVHLLSNEKAQCQVNTILSNGHAVGFSPDTLDQAHTDGFDNCGWCIGNSKR
jgi:hypothetical protein